MILKKTLLVTFICLILSLSSIAEKVTVKSSSIKLSGHDFFYKMSGRGQVKIIFLHGLFADSSAWDKIVEFFNPGEYTCIAPDLACYGQSASYPVQFAALENQVQLLNEFINKLSLKKVNLAGNSLGGMLALAYSEKFSDNVVSVSLIGAPAGFFPWSDDMMKQFNKDMNPFIPQSVNEFKFELKCLFMNPPELPEDYITKAVGKYTDSRDRFFSIFNIVSASIYNFSTIQLHESKCPVMIILGQGENIFNIINAENILSAKLPGCELYNMPYAGHLVMLEQPAKVADLYIRFLKK